MANAVVNSGGMCWTITIPGAVGGKPRQQLLERLHATGAHSDDDDPLARPAAGRIGDLGQDHVGRVPRVGRARQDDPRATAAGPRARRCGCFRAGSATIPPSGSALFQSGLAMTSIAPISSAVTARSAWAVQSTTGSGCWRISLRRNVSPSIRGISTSSTITPGTDLREHRDRFVGIGGQHDPEPRVGLDDRLEPLPHQRTVVDDQNLEGLRFGPGRWPSWADRAEPCRLTPPSERATVNACAATAALPAGFRRCPWPASPPGAGAGPGDSRACNRSSSAK